MSEWLSGNLGDIADIVMGQSPTGESVNTNGLGVPLLNGPTEFTIRYPKAVQFSTDPKRFSKVNDILFCVRGSTTGRMNWADQDYAIGRGLAAIRHKQGAEYRYFVKAILDYYLDTMLASASGSTFPNVSKDQLNDLEISYPPLSEQKAIALVLSSLDDKIDLLHRQNKTLEAMAETLFHHWFMEDESLEQITVNDLIEFNPKRTLRKGTEATYLEMAGLSTQSFNATGYYTREFTSGTKFINQDTLLARITPCLENGKAGYVTFLSDNEVGWGSTEYIVMRPKSGIHPLMAYVLCRNQDFKDYAESCMEGSSGRQRVNVDHLKEFTIGKPSDEVIQQFNDYLESIESKLIYNSKQIQTLENLRNTLLPKLMSGEVRVQYQTEDVA